MDCNWLLLKAVSLNFADVSLNGWNSEALSRALHVFAMNEILLSLTYVILLKAVQCRLPPLVRSYESFALNELLEVHEVMALALIVEDTAAKESLNILRRDFDFHALFLSLDILKKIWYSYLKWRKQRSLPNDVCALIDKLNKRLRGPVAANFPDDALAFPWSFQCLQVLERLEQYFGSCMSLVFFDINEKISCLYHLFCKNNIYIYIFIIYICTYVHLLTPACVYVNRSIYQYIDMHIYNCRYISIYIYTYISFFLYRNTGIRYVF